MNSTAQEKDASFRLRDLGSIIAGVIGGAIVAGGIGLVVGILLDIVGNIVGFGSWRGSWSLHLFAIGLFLGPVLGLILSIVSVGRRISTTKTAIAEQRESRARAVADEAVRQQKALEDSILASVRQGASTYQQLPQLLGEAAGALQRARRCFADSAYSPFWSEIEAVYGALSNYRRAITRIGDLSRRHGEAAARLGQASAPVFPVALDETASLLAAETLSEQAGELVYEAQRDAVFAQIWEQRRTTAAVIAGFQSLQQVVNQMGQALRSEVAALRSEVTQGNARVELNAVRSHEIAGAQLSELQVISSTVDAAAKDLERQYRLLRYGS